MKPIETSLCEKTYWYALVLLVNITAGCFGPDVGKIQHLKEPRFVVKPDAKALTLKLTGLPEEISGVAWGKLFKVAYGLDEKFRKTGEAPRARWENLAAPGQQLTATFAILVDESLPELPTALQAEYPEVDLATWKYGEVGEVLHIGPYDAENPTVERLREFIKKSGYQISGFHEEEYYKGPGMFFKGNKNYYHTIIRYQVKRGGK